MKSQNPGGRDRKIMSSKQLRLYQETPSKVEEEEGRGREGEEGEKRGKNGKKENKTNFLPFTCPSFAPDTSLFLYTSRQVIVPWWP